LWRQGGNEKGGKWQKNLGYTRAILKKKKKEAANQVCRRGDSHVRGKGAVGPWILWGKTRKTLREKGGRDRKNKRRGAEPGGERRSRSY